MKNSRGLIVVFAAVFSLLVATRTSYVLAADMPTDNKDVDNTQMNQGDGNASAVTADHAKQNMSDTELMRQIRKSVIADHSLSTYAHNVKIIAQNGMVTLKGPVKSADEKQSVMNKAVTVAGMDNVKDQMTVKETSN